MRRFEEVARRVRASGREVDRAPRAVVDLDRLVVRGALDVFGDEEIGRLGGRGTGEERRSEQDEGEEERLDPDDFTPARFERSFGRGRDGAAVEFDRGDRLVRFHGRIDRIDVAPDGRFRVVDYKTGRLAGSDQDLAGGTALQLPVYLLAAARDLGRPLEAGEALYRRVGAGGRRSIRFAGDRWEESGDEFARIIATVTRGIEEGLFFAGADDRMCERCDFAIACTAGGRRLFERKARRDQRSRNYLEMRGMDEEEK